MAITDIDPSAAGKASGVARRRAILANAERAQLVDQTVELLDAEEIGTKMVQAAVNLIQAAAEGVIPQPETPLERKQLADAAKVIYMMGRLELGQSTSNVAYATAGDRDAQLADIQRRAAALAAEQGSASQ